MALSDDLLAILTAYRTELNYRVGARAGAGAADTYAEVARTEEQVADLAKKLRAAGDTDDAARLEAAVADRTPNPKAERAERARRRERAVND